MDANWDPVEAARRLTKNQRKSALIFSVALLVLGLLVCTIGVVGLVQEHRGTKDTIAIGVAWFIGLSVGAGGLWGLLTPRPSLEDEPLVVLARERRRQVVGILLLTSQDSEVSWWLHAYLANSARPAATLRFEHADSARKAAATMRQIFPEAIYQERITE